MENNKNEKDILFTDLTSHFFANSELYETFNKRKNRILNTISSDIKEVETYLNQHKIDVEFEFEVCDYDDEIGYPGPTLFMLAWKLGTNGKFRLHYGELTEFPEPEWTPLIECKIEIRRKAYARLNNFLDGLKFRLESELEEESYEIKF